MAKHLSTGTAADLLTYDTFHHVSKNTERLMRVATASEEWVVRDWDGEMYVIKFNLNFSKKHLFTFSKDVEQTKTRAGQEAQKPGQAGQDAQNWNRAEVELLKNKIAKNLDKRAIANVCNCTHVFNQHLNPPPPAAAPAGRVLGNCQTAGCLCVAFKTPYALARRYVGKAANEDPLSGATTPKNTCIILNWVPKSEFEEVVCKSIQAHEKPPGWVTGTALAVPVIPAVGATNAQILAGTRVLRWDFGLARNGVIIVADKTGGLLVPVYTNYRGCFIKAKKVGSAMGRQTWVVFHMETGAPHLPF